MGSGRANDELTYSAKKPREKRRREKLQRNRLLALGVPENKVKKLNTKQVREMLQRPAAVKKLMAAAKPA